MRFKGLLEGADKVLSPATIDRFDEAILRHDVNSFGFSVKEPGLQVLAQLENEELAAAEIRSAYQLRLNDLHETAVGAATPSPFFPCCPHHKLKFADLRSNFITDVTSRLSSWLELVPTPEMVGSLPIDRTDLISLYGSSLSRFLPLDVFLKHNMGIDRSLLSASVYAAEVDRVSRILDSRLPRAVRQTGLSVDLGPLRGKVGSYQQVLTSGTRWLECPLTTVFASFTALIDAGAYNRAGAPDEILLALGLPFGPGVVWIELCYDILHLQSKFTDPRHAGAIPTAIEARAWWPFRVDRDVPRPVNGYTRNLRDDSRGLPEMIHDGLDATSITDAIVWGAPSSSSWGAYSCLTH